MIWRARGFRGRTRVPTGILAHVWRASPIDWIGRTYRVEEDGETVGTVGFGSWSGHGGIVLGDQRLAIVREGYWNPKFHLERDRKRMATASSLGVLRRGFQLVQGDEQYRLDPTSAWSRSYALSRNGSHLGQISAAGVFSRAALIELAPELAPELRLFAFWIVALAWRRGAAAAAAT